MRTVERMNALDVNLLHRWGSLTPGRYSSVSWKHGEYDAGSIGVRAERDRLVLEYTFAAAEDREAVTETVLLCRTPCNYGGQRPWFVCPNCARRVGKLYLAGKEFYCRRCWRLGYQSQAEPARYRSLKIAQRIRMRLGGSGNISEPFPWKSRWMHWKTYEKLRLQAERAEMRFLGQLDAWMRGRGWL